MKDQTSPPRSDPIIQPVAPLHLFTEPAILQQIGSRRFVKLFGGFRDDLKTASILLPTAESENGSYFESLARLLHSSALPDALRGVLFTIEAAASSSNQDRLDSAIQRRIPTVSLSSCCALDRALELWFHAPDELSQFQTSSSTRSSPRPSDGRGIEGEGSLSLDTQASPAPSPPSTPDPRHSAPCNDATLQPPHNATVQSANAAFAPLDPEPWPEPVDGNVLLNKLVRILSLFVVLPKWAAETLALWILHTYAFQLRDVTTYIGIESPEKRCGKTTLLSLLSELANRAVASSNISPPAFFRVIEDLSPTLLIDEVDTFLTGNDQLKGILNAGYHRKTAFVLRATNFPRPAAGSGINGEGSLSVATRPSDGGGIKGEGCPSVSPPPDTRHSTLGTINATHDFQLARFSCWCPKALAKIGRFPDTLADRCIIIRMQRKTSKEHCERSRDLDSTSLKQQCLRFVADHAATIATAKPQLPPELNDRAADIWEPLLVLADLAGGEWPQLARHAAIGLSASAQESSPIGSLLLDIFSLFTIDKVDRMFTYTLLAGLNSSGSRPWKQPLKGKEATDLWLAQQLRPYGVKSRTMRIGEQRAKGYLEADFLDVFRRYIPRSEVDALLADHGIEPRDAEEQPTASSGQPSQAQA